MRTPWYQGAALPTRCTGLQAAQRSDVTKSGLKLQQNTKQASTRSLPADELSPQSVMETRIWRLHFPGTELKVELKPIETCTGEILLDISQSHFFLIFLRIMAKMD